VALRLCKGRLLLDLADQKGPRLGLLDLEMAVVQLAGQLVDGLVLLLHYFRGAWDNWAHPKALGPHMGVRVIIHFLVLQIIARELLNVWHSPDDRLLLLTLIV